MEQNQFKCSGDCLNCRMNPVERKTQWQYCAAQFTYNTMRMIEAMQGSLSSLSGTVEVEAIQNNEANVFDPTKEGDEMLKSPSEELKSPIAQSGDGAV